MSRSTARFHSVLLLPLVLLTVSLLEELGWNALRHHVTPATHRVAVRLVLEGAAFALAAKRFEPWLRAFFVRARAGAKRSIGVLGPIAFYSVAYGLLYGAYFLLETRGPRALLP